MKWLLKRFLCILGIHFHSRRGRYLIGYGNGTFDNPTHYHKPEKIPDDASRRDYSCGCLAIPIIADICPVCGHRRELP